MAVAFRRAIATNAVTPGATPVKLNTLVTFNAGTTRVLVQNIDPTNQAEWAYTTGSAPSSGSMGILTPFQAISFNWEERDINNVHVAHVAAKKLFVMEEGL